MTFHGVIYASNHLSLILLYGNDQVWIGFLTISKCVEYPSSKIKMSWRRKIPESPTIMNLKFNILSWPSLLFIVILWILKITFPILFLSSLELIFDFRIGILLFLIYDFNNQLVLFEVKHHLNNILWIRNKLIN